MTAPISRECAHERHEDCDARVCIGHTEEEGSDFDPCGCGCHDEPAGPPPDDEVTA